MPIEPTVPSLDPEIRRDVVDELRWQAAEADQPDRAVLRDHARQLLAEHDVDVDTLLRAKWLLDDVDTLPAAAARLRSEADRLDQLAVAGAVLDGRVTDDYGSVLGPDALALLDALVDEATG